MDAHSLERLDFFRIRDILARYALTGLGRSLAQNVHPVTRLALVQRWLAQVTELQALAEERGLPPFGGISDVREVLHRCAPPLRVNVDEVSRLGSTLAGTHAMADYLRNLPENFPEFRHLAERVGDFQPIADRIGAVIDERGQVRDDASPKLRRIRADISVAVGQTDEVVSKLLRDPNVRKYLQYPNHTFHGDRLVVPLRTEYRGRVPGIVHRTSDTGATLYVEPGELVELNNRISNLRSEEQEEIGRLLWDLAHEVHLNSKEIHRTLETLAVIDLVVAKLRYAKEFEARCPQINGEGTLSVRGARHPLLLELSREKRAAGEPGFDVVPIDYRLGVDFNLLIITGPNTGGKTVTLKTIGLLALMVQAGIPVPVAAGSEFGVFTNVLIDVGDEQSMQQSLSTFSAHLTRLMDMLRHAGPRAMLLIDELGAGTDPDEGAAIGRAVMDELLRLKCRCVVSTHLGALKGFALMRPAAENACVQFDAQTLRPTYHLVLGEPGSSNAIEIASRLGMPRRLVASAYRNLSRKARALHSALEGTRIVKRQAETARKEAEDAKLAADKVHTEAQAARAHFEQQKADFATWVQRVVHLQPGDAVRVRGFDRDGKIVRLRIDQQRAEVDVGAFAVEVPLGDVLPPQTPAPPPRPVAPPPVVLKRPRKPQGERGPAGGVVGQVGAAAGQSGASGQGGAAGGAPGGQSVGRGGKPDGHRDGPPEPRRAPALPESEVAALQPGDHVFIQRFQRDGRVVRVNASKKSVLVDVGLLEVEVPFDGLGRSLPKPARPTSVVRKRPAPPPSEARDAADGKPGEGDAAPPAGPEQATE